MVVGYKLMWYKLQPKLREAESIINCAIKEKHLVTA